MTVTLTVMPLQTPGAAPATAFPGRARVGSDNTFD